MTCAPLLSVVKKSNCNLLLRYANIVVMDLFVKHILSTDSILGYFSLFCQSDIMKAWDSSPIRHTNYRLPGWKPFRHAMWTNV